MFPADAPIRCGGLAGVTRPAAAPVLLERRGDIAIVRLNRPDKRNALDSTTLAAFNSALADLAADDSLRVVVLSTTDTAALCAGADVGEVLDHDGGVARMAAFTRMYSLLDEFPVPIVAVAVGNCVGAGAEIVASADLRVGGDNLKLAWAGARLGVPVGPARLGPLIGVARAKDLVFTGRALTMVEAVVLGLLQRTAPAHEAENIALHLAEQVAAQQPDGVRVLKRMFRDLDGTAGRVAYENAELMRFQEHGAGLPRTR
jgi:enoyl-CoA hydratase/carnithine racemase